MVGLLAFDDVAVNARRQGAENILAAVRGAEDDDLRLRAPLTHLRNPLGTRQAGHAQIDNGKAQVLVLQMFHRLGKAARFQEFLDLEVASQQLREPHPEDLVIIGDQHRTPEFAPAAFPHRFCILSARAPCEYCAALRQCQPACADRVNDSPVGAGN